MSSQNPEFFFKLLLISFLSFFSSCEKANRENEREIIESGVSKELADYRKEVISDLHYKLKFSIPDSLDQPIEASERIIFELKKNELPLQLDFKGKPNQLKKLTVNGKEVSLNYINEHLIIQPAELKKGQNEIIIEFLAGDMSLNRNEDYLYTLLVPDRTRTIFPSFDQPNLKATFDLTLSVPNGWQALANGAVEDSIQIRNKTVYQFATSDKFSTYLFSFAAGKFKKVSRTLNGVEMNFYHRETDQKKIQSSMDPIFQIHADALKFLEDYTQIPYPFQKFDFIAIPGFQYGGMEHVGAIDYKASTLFLDEGATKSEEISRMNLIAHETAHMWFGDLVTMDWFDDVWMKEVFANFMADKANANIIGDSNFELKFLLSHFPSAYSVDRTRGANPIRQELDNLQDAGSLYGNIIYHKAPIMMKQLERLIGEEPFKKGIRTYLETYAFENATWPQLIEILDEETDSDLKSWNQVWVNEAGRTQFDYKTTQDGGYINAITISQRDPSGQNRFWPQVFEILMVYPDSVQELTIQMDAPEVALQLKDKITPPEYILFNSSGQGYGIFPIDSNWLENPSKLYELENPVQRASAYINSYENMLAGNYLSPVEFLELLKEGLTKEKEELNLNRLTNYLSEVYWKFIPADQRNPERLEKELWRAIQENSEPNAKKMLFQTYQNIAQSENALKNLYQIWSQQVAPEGVRLSEEDYTALALALAVRDYKDDILDTQLERIENPDRKERLAFIKPALSEDEAIRDAFFYKLKDPKNREKEAWVASALQYLHHPLRTESSVKYLQESLELLEEIQLTGDIFFPARWLQATFSAYHSDAAVAIVNNFLEEHEDYNPKLRDKILQAADDLYRANELLRNK
ncbi:M1 family aminopeptidase [Marivirga sp.]|uniref:M1 family metallopeptidase n=1 Tax=Marivirga sp. TaxID=2018662 RepID=UPI002D7F5A64|nr:M1 family aminopeptidase [Marivirga sp.]HET8859601.1 M1 family aminopeptidase [Marivirga sp.]